jgi:hypothetical protein
MPQFRSDLNVQPLSRLTIRSTWTPKKEVWFHPRARRLPAALVDLIIFQELYLPRTAVALVFSAAKSAYVILAEPLLLASDSMCRLRFFRGWVLGPLDERSEQIKWDRQNGRGAMLARNFFHRLQEAQLQGDRLRRNHRCRLHEFLRGLKLAFGVYDFRPALPLRLGLAGHRALHAVGQNNVSDLYGSYFDSPRIGLPIDDLL